jgi:hypothetical protein
MTGLPWWLASLIGGLLLVSVGVGVFLWWVLRRD